MPRKKQAAEGGRETNVEFVTRLMERSKSGPLAQLFVVEAVRKYAEACSKAEPKQMDVGFITGQQWKRTAEEIHEQMTRHLGE
jgi:hypothetical protein